MTTNQKNTQTLVGIIGDKDTVTGFLLAGIGQKDKNGSNFLVVDVDTKQEEIEETFKRFTEQGNISIAESHLRPLINTYNGIIPTILEIPSKDHPYELKKDPITTKAAKLLFGTDAGLDD